MTGSPPGRGELRKAGLEGGTDEIRARAYLDLLLGQDSRPRRPPAPAPGRCARGVRQPGHPDRPAGHPDPPRGPARRAAGLGPVDPWLARDLATAAARNPKTTWCLTVTDNQGHAIAHGCARPEPKSHRKRAGPGPPGFRFTPASRDGPPGSGYGTWRLRTPGPGPGPDHHPGTRSPPTPATTGTKPRATTPGPGSGTCPRSGTPPAPAPSAAGPPPSATWSTTPPTKQADAPVSATPARSAGTTTASSSTPNGRSTSSPTAPSGGPPQPAGPTPPNPPATPSERHRRASSPQIA